jgi:hypothetical protein
MTAEKHSHYQNSVNCFRKLLGKLWQSASIWNFLFKQDGTWWEFNAGVSAGPALGRLD